jgi:hypothetical protein
MAQSEQDQMQRIYQATQTAVSQYYKNPAMFTDEEVSQIKKAADSLGISFSPNFSGKRALKNAAYELGEGLTFGLLPNSFKPTTLNPLEDLAGTAGGLLGLAAPIGVGMKAGKMAMRGAEKLAAGKGIGIAAKRAFGADAKGIAAAINGIKNKSIRKKMISLAMKAQHAMGSQGIKNFAGRALEAKIPGMVPMLGGKSALQYGSGIGAGMMANKFFDQPSEEELMEQQMLQQQQLAQ